MPDISETKTTATTYPPDSLYEVWVEDATERNMTISQYIMRMVEAGRQDIDLDELTNESVQQLRQQRADLQRELEYQRNRVRELEQQLHHTAQVDILEYIEDNPGARTPEIIQHVANTVPARVASHLDVLEGNAITKRDDGYYLDATDVDAALEASADIEPTVEGDS